jgi:hypothetical protein
VADDEQIAEERGGVHCYRITSVFAPGRGEPLEVTGFLCGKFGDPCIQCGDVSEVLCDYPLGEQGRTCDKPLCLRCAPEVGVDKNYCAEHNELGSGLLLFRRPPNAGELSVDRQVGMDTLMNRKPRLPKAPPAGRRWRVVSEGGVALGPWEDEISARRDVDGQRTKGYAVEVQSWESFVRQWRQRYPLKKRKPRVASGNKPHVALDCVDPRGQRGVKEICNAEHQLPLEDRDL